MSELKPCPFCGADPRVSMFPTHVSVECSKCSCHIDGDQVPSHFEKHEICWDYFKDTAFVNWNRRCNYVKERYLSMESDNLNITSGRW